MSEFKRPNVLAECATFSGAFGINDERKDELFEKTNEALSEAGELSKSGLVRLFIAQGDNDEEVAYQAVLAGKFISDTERHDALSMILGSAGEA